MKFNGALSSKLVSRTGSPQGCVLAPLLFLPYTNDCRSNCPNRHFIKFADDTVLVSLLNDDENGHGTVVDEFIGGVKGFIYQCSQDQRYDHRFLRVSEICLVYRHLGLEIVI